MGAPTNREERKAFIRPPNVLGGNVQGLVYYFLLLLLVKSNGYYQLHYQVLRLFYFDRMSIHLTSFIYLLSLKSETGNGFQKGKDVVIGNRVEKDVSIHPSTQQRFMVNEGEEVC